MQYIQPLKSGHLTNQCTFYHCKGVLTLYSYALIITTCRKTISAALSHTLYSIHQALYIGHCMQIPYMPHLLCQGSMGGASCNEISHHHPLRIYIIVRVYNCTHTQIVQMTRFCSCIVMVLFRSQLFLETVSR